MTLDFFFDPGCPWTWLTSRWAMEVAPQRDVPIRWRAYSVDIDDDAPPTIPQRALRVVEAVWAEHGDDPIGGLYTELGTRFHLQGDVSLDAVAAALGAAGLDPALVAAADEERWDAEIRGSMADATDRVGQQVGVPILVFFDEDRVAGISGPIMARSVTGPRAVALWDHVVGLAWNPDVLELKRSRPSRPQL
jgi:2-hydroxychromene-2-carboxylate isomerase